MKMPHSVDAFIITMIATIIIITIGSWLLLLLLSLLLLLFLSLFLFLFFSLSLLLLLLFYRGYYCSSYYWFLSGINSMISIVIVFSSGLLQNCSRLKLEAPFLYPAFGD